MLQEFKDFISKGNLVEIAVGLVMAGAFGLLVTSFMDNIIGGLIAGIFGKPSLDGSMAVWSGRIKIGNFITSILNFITVAIVMFAVVKAYNKFKKAAPPADPTASEKLLAEIRDSLRGR
jgi:large conductance mechanosensitive channel